MSNGRRHQADFSLLLVTLVWGTTFVVVKRAIEDIPPFPFLTLRFGLAFLTLLPFIWHQRSSITRDTIIKGLGLGIVLFSGYAWQTLGLQYTTASNAAFITGLAVVLVPLLVVLTTKKMPKLALILGVVSATIGLALLTLGDSLQLNRGDMMMLLCAFSFALQIYLVGRFAPTANATGLAAGQILAVTLLSGLFSLILPQPSPNFTLNSGFALLLTAIPATSLAFYIQSKMQQFTTPTHTALIFAAEPVFAALFAYLFADEILSTKGIIGASLVLAGMLLAEFTGTEELGTDSK